MKIPEEHKRTIRRLVSRNKAVAQATCDIPHIPVLYLREGRDEDGELPLCGCFVGTYAWMQQCSLGKGITSRTWWDIPKLVADHIGISEASVDNFGAWCNTRSKDRLAVNYALEVLASA